MNKHTSILSLNYFPTLLTENKKDKNSIINSTSNNINDAIKDNYDLRIAEHTDVSMFTIVAQSSPGLEVYNYTG